VQCADVGALGVVWLRKRLVSARESESIKSAGLGSLLKLELSWGSGAD